MTTNHLHQLLAEKVDAWRTSAFLCSSYPNIAEILEYARGPIGHARFLRQPQLRALETYWYLRLVENTPKVIDLYRKFYPSVADRLAALGLSHSDIKDIALNEGIEALLERVKTNDEFVRTFKLEALRETLTLDYPSYILALAMGAGKTILIGSIFASEFAMAMEYPDGPFVQNALIFAPGLTIIESLRELVQIPYENILPPRLHKTFAASIKITFTRSGEKDVPIVRGSVYNVVVTNTERIRIQKETIRKSDLGGLFAAAKIDEARAEVANLRLQAIASLPHLAVFSDEAHHTYGQSLSTGLKKVRKTVDYLAANTNVLCVVNTTGTPYFQRQPLKDVVVWYGLSEGVRDNILKDPSDNIIAYDFKGDARKYVAEVVSEFFKNYGDVRLPNGAAAKLAIYFPQTDDLKELRPVIDEAMTLAGQSPALCLVNTSDDTLTKKGDIDAFNRLNDPGAPHRVVLLVNKGTEGWNCPSLFACALARSLKSSNNFVLQAATRCLRQVPGNTVKASIYLSTDNWTTLDSQLKETYGESLDALNHAQHEVRRARLVLRKPKLPPMVVRQTIRTVVRQPGERKPLQLARPVPTDDPLIRRTFTLGQQVSTSSVLQQVGEAVVVATRVDSTDVYAAAVDLAARYRLDLWEIYDELRRLYGTEDIADVDMDALAQQIESQTSFYEIHEEQVDVALALVRPEGFTVDTDAQGNEVYTTEIVYRKEREHLLMRWDQMRKDCPLDLSFHVDPYNFDSNPEKNFFEQILKHLNVTPNEVEDFLYTGSLTSRDKTDFYVEYKDDKEKWHTYTPDFILRKKPKKGRPAGSGRVFLIEIKAEKDRNHPVDGATGRKAMALQHWEKLNPGQLRYEMIFTAAETVSPDATGNVICFAGEAE